MRPSAKGEAKRPNRPAKSMPQHSGQRMPKQPEFGAAATCPQLFADVLTFSFRIVKAGTAGLEGEVQNSRGPIRFRHAAFKSCFSKYSEPKPLPNSAYFLGISFAFFHPPQSRGALLQGVSASQAEYQGHEIFSLFSNLIASPNERHAEGEQTPEGWR